MHFSKPTLENVALLGGGALAVSFLLPKVVKGSTSKKLSGALFTLGGLALLGAAGVVAEQKLLKA